MGQHTTAAEQATHGSNGYRVSVWPDEADARGLESYAALDHALQTLDRSNEDRMWRAMRAAAKRSDATWTMDGCTHPVHREQDAYWSGSLLLRTGTHVRLTVCCGAVEAHVTHSSPAGRVTTRRLGTDAVSAVHTAR